MHFGRITFVEYTLSKLKLQCLQILKNISKICEYSYRKGEHSAFYEKSGTTYANFFLGARRIPT